jgi:GT2 family glycosyltransferase
MAAARGTYIARMDADDISLPQRLDRQQQFLENHPDYALVGSPYYQIDEQGQIRCLIRVLTEDAELRAGLQQQNWFGHGSVMMRREAVEQLGGYDERFTYAQDYDLWLRMSEQFNIANLDEPLYCWRATSACISQSKIKEQEYFAKLARKRAAAREKSRKTCGQREITEISSTSPMVSVIVPTYNRPEMLVTTIQSILDQTYTDYEIIVVNDCGLEVESIVAWLNQHQNITYVRHGRNRGLAAARNTGITLSRGKYLAYLDDDDIFYPDHLETLVTFLETSDFRVAYTDALRALQVKKHGRYATVDRDLLYSHEFDADRLIVENQFPVLCLMHERACLDQAGLFDESLTTHEDWDLWIRLSLHDNFAHIKKVTCEYSWRDDGSTMSSSKALDFVRTLEIVHAKYQQNLRDKPRIREMQRQFLQQQKAALGLSDTGAGGEGCKPDELLAKAAVAMEKQDWAAAEGFLRELTRQYPDLLEPYLVLSDALTMQGKHQEASEVLRAARRLDPEALPLLRRLGLNSRQRGDLSIAMAAFTRAWNQTPQDPELLGHLSTTCLDVRLHEEAKGYYHEALRENPENIDLWLGLAQVARHLDDQVTLEESYRQAATLNPSHPRLLELTRGLRPAGDRAASPPPARDRSSQPAGPQRAPASIIIPVFNNLELTQNCLASIWEHTPPDLYEVILVDNASTDATPAFLGPLAAAGKIHLITNETNLGYAKACNQAARAARGDYLVMLNNDTLVTSGWLNALIEAVEQDDNLAIVGAKLLYPDDSVQHAGVVFNHKGKVYHLYRCFHRDHPAVNKTREFQVVTAACLLIRTAVFRQVGLFDENFVNGFEDLDLCLRVRQSGYRIVYNPDCVVYHLESMTPGRGDDDLDNSRYFMEKWRGHRIVPDDHRYYEEDGLWIEWTVNSEGEREAVIHDENDNPYKQEARTCLSQGDLPQALALYKLALRFNPFDPRNRALIAEVETLKDMAAPQSQAVHA